MKLPLKVIVHNEDETRSLSREFSTIINEGDVVVLNGNLGAGKTFFIRELLNQFNIGNVNSPTFSLVNEYYGNRKIYHFDFYRIEKERELFDIGFDEYMNDEEAIKFIEWGSLFSSWVPHTRKEINIRILDEISREFSIEEFS